MNDRRHAQAVSQLEIGRVVSPAANNLRRSAHSAARRRKLAVVAVRTVDFRNVAFGPDRHEESLRKVIMPKFHERGSRCTRAVSFVALVCRDLINENVERTARLSPVHSSKWRSRVAGKSNDQVK
jgi:hypothetical protein